MIWGIRTQFPQIAPIPEYLGNKYSSTHREQWHYIKVSFDVKQGAEDFGLLFRCPLHMIWDIQVQFPQIAPIPEYL